MFYLAEPSSGKYTLAISNPVTSTTKISTYLYDVNGEVKVAHTNAFGNGEYTINFDKNNSSKSTISKYITFESTLQDIYKAERQHMINKGFAISLKAIVFAAENQYGRNKTISRKLLEGGLKLLNESRRLPRIISPEAYQILAYDFKELIKSTK